MDSDQRSGVRIGGEFEIAPALLEHPGRPLPGGAYYATGRGALAAILRDARRTRSGEIVLVPDYVCESVVQTVIALGLVPQQYEVSADLNIDLDVVIDLARGNRRSLLAIIFVDYFGLSACDRWVSCFKAALPEVPVIRDSVQALFEMGKQGSEDYRFTSLRKWLPTPDGASVTGVANAVLPMESESGFVAHKLLGSIERYWTQDALTGSDDDAYRHVERGERDLEALGTRPAPMSMVSRVILSNTDFNQVAVRRRINFTELSTMISAHGLRPILDLTDNRVPYFLPIRVQDRDRVRAHLREEQIYCPAHWPRHSLVRTAVKNDLWDQELSLVIDQRYGTADMARLSDALGRALKLG